MQLDRPHGQMSDSFLMSAFIILSGGLQDAYTYCCRDKVFANAQTGNIVFLSTALFQKDWPNVVKYLIPVVSFLIGTAAAELIHIHFKTYEKIHWRQIILFCEIVFLLVVGFLPAYFEPLANAMVSFVCAMQVQTFRKVRGHAYASTMCIGNMRSGMDSLCSWVLNRNPAALKKSLYYWGIILLFALGAGLGSLALDLCGAKAIWFSCLLLAVSFCLMFLKEDIEELEEFEHLEHEEALKK